MFSCFSLELAWSIVIKIITNTPITQAIISSTAGKQLKHIDEAVIQQHGDTNATGKPQVGLGEDAFIVDHFIKALWCQPPDFNIKFPAAQGHIGADGVEYVGDTDQGGSGDETI